MLNTITIQGRLVHSPELRYTQNQTPVVSFTLACEQDFKDNDGYKQTDFIDCVAWRSTAVFMNKYFEKGNLAIVNGRLHFRDWTDKDGNKRRNAEVMVSNIYFCESKKKDGNSEPSSPADNGNTNSELTELPDDGYLPF